MWCLVLFIGVSLDVKFHLVGLISSKSLILFLCISNFLLVVLINFDVKKIIKNAPSVILDYLDEYNLCFHIFLSFFPLSYCHEFVIIILKGIKYKN